MGVSHAGAGGEAPRAVGSPSAAAPLSGTAGRDSLQSVARRQVAGSPSLSAPLQKPQALVLRVPAVRVLPPFLGLRCKTLCLREQVLLQ